jgi:hypothetical protein
MIDVIESASEREAKVQRWIAALLAAEKAAKAEAARNGSKPRLYLVSYRVKEEDAEARGTADQRRSALIRILDSLVRKEKHLSTSTWIVRLHMLDASDIICLLSPPLAPIDFLSVAQVSPRNRVTQGDANLK